MLKRVPIRDEQTKLPITTPIPLDNNGNPYSKEELEAGQAHYVKVKGYYEANFSLLGLD